MAHLHERALHVAERVGDLFRRAELVSGVQLLAVSGGGKDTPRPMHGVRGPGAAPDRGQLHAPTGPAVDEDRVRGVRRTASMDAPRSGDDHTEPSEDEDAAG